MVTVVLVSLPLLRFRCVRRCRRCCCCWFYHHNWSERQQRNAATCTITTATVAAFADVDSRSRSSRPRQHMASELHLIIPQHEYHSTAQHSGSMTISGPMRSPKREPGRKITTESIVATSAATYDIFQRKCLRQQCQTAKIIVINDMSNSLRAFDSITPLARLVKQMGV
ncbi:uncharacterized protein LOC111266825 [Varroa jacobsoni]|uniref:uncharacterized protein LOC111266825 n=1 Tax=Varroa jacobsoni TaxID=62625 RepID=UPI000BF2F75E|nr:uncharacterized protein LOC111266825 [Varroa jacobsoni]